jgi:type I restriction enzyme M protein
MIRLHFRNSLFIPLLQNMMDRISQTLTQRVKELAERYDKPLPVLTEQADAMESKVRAHLERMGFAWQ